MKRYKYTDEELLNILKEKAKELGRTPKKREVKQFGAICQRFGSWNNAVIKAGLKPLKIYGLTKEDYKKIIIEWIKENKKVPTISEFYNNPYLPDPRHIERKFCKNWSNIIKELGFQPNHENIEYNYSKEELIEIFKNEYNKNKPKKQKDYDILRTKGTPSITCILTNLNTTWNNLLKEVIGVPEQEIKKWSYKDKELIDKLKEIINKLGRTPSITELENLGYPYTTLKRRFGGYNNALKTIGIKINSKSPVKVKETDEELLKMYIEFSKKLGKPASAIDLNNSDEIYNSDVFIMRFGGMYELKKIAGFKPVKKINKKYTKEQIKKMLLYEYNKKGRKLTNKEIFNNKNLPSVTTITRYFHTTKMSEVWHEIINKS